MEQQLTIGDSPEASWSTTTTPSSDVIEDPVRLPPPPIIPFTIPRSRQMRQPIRGRLRLERRKNPGWAKMYETLEISLVESRSSMEASEPSPSSALTMITSATSPGEDAWGGFVEEEEGEAENEAKEIDWEQEEERIVVPKLEPIDDFDMEGVSDAVDVKEDILSETLFANAPATQGKRPRGRPRKHPKPTPESMAKVAKGRSKTGCITCRRRKKKCDETKPGCMNCEKNSVTCEGYSPKTIWKSGKEKAEEATRLRRSGSFTLPNIQLPPMINGIETEGDRMFFQHYITRLSLKFTVEGEDNSAFKNMLLPIAMKHTGLMHSILAMSSKHIDFRSPYGLKFLQEHPSVDVKTLEERTQFHHDEAVKDLVQPQPVGDSSVAIAATYGQILCLVLQTLSDEQPSGQHRFHLQHYQKLIRERPPEDEEFLKFIHEFFQYHIVADELIALPPKGTRLLASDEWNLPTTVLQPAAVRLLGVSDGLFLYMSKITNIRNKIRENMEAGVDPVVDFPILFRATEIDAGIREWTPSWPEGDARDLDGLLYKQMMWVYLWRTIYPPETKNWVPDSNITRAVDDGIQLLGSFGANDPSQTLILAPAFVLGCAAFQPKQRDPIRKALATVKAYTEFKNSDTALKVLEEVWRLMDAKDERSWDWQSIAHEMGMDFLAT